MPDHDHAFKELLGEFFPEFIDLFFPQVATYNASRENPGLSSRG